MKMPGIPRIVQIEQIIFIDIFEMKSTKGKWYNLNCCKSTSLDAINDCINLLHHSLLSESCHFLM